MSDGMPFDDLPLDDMPSFGPPPFGEAPPPPGPAADELPDWLTDAPPLPDEFGTQEMSADAPYFDGADDALPNLAELARLPAPPEFPTAGSRLSDTPPPIPRPAPRVLPLPPAPVPISVAPAPDGWVVSRVAVPPQREADGTLIAFRLTVRPDADRGYQDCRIRFPLPPGVKQVHANRKPLARKGWLNWEIGPVAAGDSVTVSVKVPFTTSTHHLLGADSAFEVSHLPAPITGRLVVVPHGPAVVPAGDPFGLTVAVTNPGATAVGPVVVKAEDRTNSAWSAATTLESLAAGETATVTLDLVAGRAGRGEWAVSAAAGGNAPFAADWAADVVEPAVGVALNHPPVVRVDGTFDLEIEVANTAAVPARGAVLVFDVPEELAFEAAPGGGTFDAGRSQVGWPVGDLAVGAARTFTVTLRGFAAGLARLRAEAEISGGGAGVAVGNVFCELDAKATTSTLEKLLDALQDTVADADDHRPAAQAAEGDRHVLFDLAGTGYAVPIGNVREVIRPPAVTPVPSTPDWLLGVANVRGDVVSVVDLARFFGIDDPAAARRAVLVTQSADGQSVVGFLVGDVAGIRRIPAAAVEPADELGDNPVAAYLTGVAELQSRLVPVLDAEALLASAELNVFETA